MQRCGGLNNVEFMLWRKPLLAMVPNMGLGQTNVVFQGLVRWTRLICAVIKFGTLNPTNVLDILRLLLLFIYCNQRQKRVLKVQV